MGRGREGGGGTGKGDSQRCWYRSYTFHSPPKTPPLPLAARTSAARWRVGVLFLHPPASRGVGRPASVRIIP